MSQLLMVHPRKDAQGWWELLIMGTAGVQTWKLSTGMVEPLITGTAGVQTWKLSTGMVGTPHNGHSGCTDLGTQHRHGGNPSQRAQRAYRPGNSAQGWWEP
ncbi:unnamed protein product, partial [Staurois parvus]